METSTAMGKVSATVAGSASTKNSMITRMGRPFPARSARRRARVLMSTTPVSARNAKRNGPMCARRRYRVRIFMMDPESLDLPPRNEAR
jgi:hypothetical protein